jgi:lantibiotic transport system ATP-binding protein
MYAVQTEELTKRFADRTVVDRVSLAVPQRSIYGFLGPNGAGKTTTIRVLLGLLKPTSGVVRYSGEAMSPRNRAAVQALIEAPSLYPHLSAYDNLEVTRRLLDVPRDAITRELERVGLSHAASQRVREFSLGMRQRLSLALTLLGSPKVLILDEPTNGLDPAGIVDMRNLIRGLVHEHGMTVLMSSHLLSEVEQLATHVGILNQGRLIFQADVDQLKQLARPQWQLACNAPEQACALLQAQGIACQLGDSALVLDGNCDSAMVNQLLVSAGFMVRSLQEVRPSLESLFFQLTQTGA